jgi:hypothetical protein
MSSFLKYASAFGLFLVLAGSAMLKAVPPGFVEGRLAIIALRESVGAELAEDGQSNRAAKAYQEYPLVVLSQDEHTEIARVMTDGEGAYRVALPPGAYILDVQNRMERHLRVRPEPFKVESNRTVRVDILISK